MNAYRTPAEIEPTLTPEEEKRFLRALRPVPWLFYVRCVLTAALVVVEIVRLRT